MSDITDRLETLTKEVSKARMAQHSGAGERQYSLAIDRLEEAFMWVVAAESEAGLR